MYSAEIHNEKREVTVLVIDDNQSIRSLLARVLRGSYKVLLADSVESALSIIEHARPSVVITDYEMPGRNGIEGAKAIRRAIPHVTIIMLSGSATDDLAQEALRQGVDECAHKPFDIRRIPDRVERHLAMMGAV